MGVERYQSTGADCFDVFHHDSRLQKYYAKHSTLAGQRLGRLDNYSDNHFEIMQQPSIAPGSNAEQQYIP